MVGHMKKYLLKYTRMIVEANFLMNYSTYWIVSKNEKWVGKRQTFSFIHEKDFIVIISTSFQKGYVPCGISSMDVGVV